MRITRMSWLIVFVGAVAFGGGIAGLARVLPSDASERAQPDAERSSGGSASIPLDEDASPAESAPIGPPPASAPVNSPELDALAFDLRNAGSATADELASLAAANDIIIDDLRWQPDAVSLTASQIAAMKAMNPRLRVLRYVSALTNNDGPIFNVAPEDGTHGPWFLRDGSGDFVRAYEDVASWNGKPSYVFDPSSIDVRNDIGAWARQITKLGYDGVLLDGVWPCVPAPSSACGDGALLSHPINKTTNRPYTDDEWLVDTTGLLQLIRRAAPNAMLFLRASGDQSPLLPYIDGTLIPAP